MPRCFVIQCFDKGLFDKRYDDVIKPAIEKAKLEPYRVDRDAGVMIPIDRIEAEIRSCGICIAEITTDNPNVWFELGYAIAAKKPVCLICSEERKTQFPFDVQHRNIIRYKVESTSDFDHLGNRIEENLKALMANEATLSRVVSDSPLAATEGLSAHEMAALAFAMAHCTLYSIGISGFDLLRKMQEVGFTDVATGLAVASLERKKMIDKTPMQDREGDYMAYHVTSCGNDWLLANQPRLRLRQEEPLKLEDGPTPF
jgi:nucleoside 2-deoxyribosyltransferase